MSVTNEYVMVFPTANRAQLQTRQRDPKPLGPVEVAGSTVATLMSAGTELSMYQGYLKEWPFPLEPGYSAVFRAEQVGPEVTDIKPGDLCFTPGGHRSFLRRNREDLLPVPAGLDAPTACFARIMAVTMATLSTTTARPPAKIGVTGLGVVGNLAAQMFQSCGYDVYACDPSDTRRCFAEQSGVKHVLPRLPLEDGNTAGQFDLVLECSGHEQAALDAIRSIRRRGEVVLVGTPWKKNTDLSAHELLYQIFHRWPIVRSGWEWEMPGRPTDFRTNSTWGNYEGALRWLAEGRIKTAGLWETVSPANPQQVYDDALAGKRAKLVTIFDWQQMK